MTESDFVWTGAGTTPARPADLPSFAGFAACGPDDLQGHPHADREANTLHPRAAPVRRRSFRLGRAAAHHALAMIGRDDGPILPAPDRRPLWPAGVVGSISHTAHLGVALVAPAERTDGVGLDIETRRHAPELDDQVPRPEERAWLAENREDLLLALFSAKESIFKAFYPRVGAFFGFEAATLEPATGGFTARLVSELDPSYPPDRTFRVHAEWNDDLVLTWLVLPRTPQDESPMRSRRL